MQCFFYNTCWWDIIVSCTKPIQIFVHDMLCCLVPKLWFLNSRHLHSPNMPHNLWAKTCNGIFMVSCCLIMGKNIPQIRVDFEPDTWYIYQNITLLGLVVVAIYQDMNNMGSEVYTPHWSRVVSSGHTPLIKSCQKRAHPTDTELSKVSTG